jgi:hypothetical protein
MRNAVLMFVVVALLSLTLAGAAYASYSGAGLVASGSPSARSGSTGGIFILGGGPGSGK